MIAGKRQSRSYFINNSNESMDKFTQAPKSPKVFDTQIFAYSVDKHVQFQFMAYQFVQIQSKVNKPNNIVIIIKHL